MKSIELRLPRDFDKSFVVFQEIGKYFPCPWHYHPEYELVLVVRSTGRRMVGDNIGFYEEGDLVCMGPHLPHVWVSDPLFTSGKADHLCEAIVIHFTDDFLGEKFLDIPEMMAFRNFLMLSARGMVIKGQARERITGLMKQMVKMNGLQRLSSLLLIFETLSWTLEYELLCSPAFVSDQGFVGTDRRNKITEFLMRNLDRNISLAEAAAASNMAVTTFCNFFRENYRVTFVEYLNTLRIGLACKKLQEEDSPIVDIAYECGFNSLANFNRQFKRYKQMTPTTYKKLVYM